MESLYVLAGSEFHTVKILHGKNVNLNSWNSS